jgi:ubiquinone/menaquinone biosynthesis C-methylase UbiE
MNATTDHEGANIRKWNKRSATYDERRYHYFRIMERALIATMPFSPSATFLDLGCGTGWAVRYMAARYRGRGRFISIDISDGMIERAKDHSQGMEHVEFYQANAEDLPFGNHSIDIIISTNSFHHYLHPEGALKESRRVLKPAGRIYILDITADDIFVRWIDRRSRRKEKEHVRFYSTTEYLQMMDEAGLLPKRSYRIGVSYPVKVHVGEMPSEYSPPSG